MELAWPLAVRKFSLILIALAFLPSCTVERSSRSFEGPTAQGHAKMANRDVKVPRGLIKEIEQWFIDSERRRDPTRAGTDLEVLSTLKRKLLNLRVVLTPKSGNALEDRVVFDLPTGGGTIDLANDITGQRGGFWVRIKLRHEIEAMSDMKVFFLGESRRRTLLGEEIGSGCDKLAEMTTWFTREHNHRDLDVYVPDQRYVSLLAGTWIFAALVKNELHLATVTFTDSRYPFLLCRSEAL